MVMQRELNGDGAFAVREPEPSTRSVEDASQPEAIEWPEEPGVVADTSLTIPGMGDRPEKCGTYLPLKYCPDCGEHEMLEHRCKGRRCPNCKSVWIGDRAEAVTKRLQAARLDEKPGVERRLLHTVFSPPETVGDSLSAFRRAAKKANRLGKEHGIRGGVVVPHAFRVKQSVKESYREAVKKGGFSGGIWKWIRQEYGSRWRAAIYYSPHFHIIGLCRDFVPSSPEEDSGWVAKNIRSLEPLGSVADKEAHDDVYGLVSYLASHASFDPEGSGHVFRWFGETAYCNFSVSDVLSEGLESALERAVTEVREEGGGSDESAECNDCGEEMRPILEAARQLENPGWCDHIGREKQRELAAALSWLRGESVPPPGLRSPGSKAGAKEALDTML